MQAWPLALVTQSTHGPPDPHADGLVPAAHMLPAQQPDAHGAAHPVEQTPSAQTAVAPAHAVHTPPVLPHAALAVPSVQKPSLAQQPLLHVRPPSQLTPHLPVEGLHAWRGGHWQDWVQPPSYAGPQLALESAPATSGSAAASRGASSAASVERPPSRARPPSPGRPPSAPDPAATTSSPGMHAHANAATASASTATHADRQRRPIRQVYQLALGG
jgi:hypothetical protein